MSETIDRCPHCGSEAGWYIVGAMRYEQVGEWGSDDAGPPVTTITRMAKYTRCIQCRKQVPQEIAMGKEQPHG